MDNGNNLGVNLPNEKAKVETIYNNNGQLAKIILGERGAYVRNIRRLCTEIEFELMNAEPDNMRVIGLATEIELLVSSIRSISYNEIANS